MGMEGYTVFLIIWMKFWGKIMKKELHFSQIQKLVHGMDILFHQAK